MPQPYIEHVNLTVSDPERMAKLLGDLFDWHVRWEGPARDNGRVIHVGDERTYRPRRCPRPMRSRKAVRSTMSASSSTISTKSNAR